MRKVGKTIQRTKLLDIPTNGNIAFDGRTIYYINEDSLLTAYDIKTHKTRPFRNMVASDFWGVTICRSATILTPIFLTTMFGLSP